ncbi:MAG: undecaprenyl-diphosphate phosphatase [Lachnospiraceae bacterium]|nr:undecaprenyl-diphosphate phosphatase [Lachnospiraceae bacterium]
MLDFLRAIVYGLVEGITEWLPISSTGHLILLEKILPFANVSEEFLEMFDVVIQLGAIIAVVVLFFKKIWPFAFTKKFKEETGSESVFVKEKWILWAKILVACVPAAIVGILLDDFVDEHFYNYICVAIALIVFGIAFIVIETIHKGKDHKIKSLDDITFKIALIIGIFQVIAAVFPGTSRSGATIVGALLIGVARPVAAEFTFFLAVPVMFGASLLKGAKFIMESEAGFSGTEVGVLAIGMVVAFAVSLVVLKFLMNYIKKHDFKVFGWYRIVLGIVVIVAGLTGLI